MPAVVLLPLPPRRSFCAGIAALAQDETYDAKIFSLGILLASFFVYNSMGVIDETAIDRLFLVGELTKSISASVVKSQADGAPPAPAPHQHTLLRQLRDCFPAESGVGERVPPTRTPVRHLSVRAVWARCGRRRAGRAGGRADGGGG